jgi:hypothetical protein
MKIKEKKFYDLFINLSFIIWIIFMIVLKNIDSWIMNKNIKDILVVSILFMGGVIAVISGIFRNKLGDNSYGPYSWRNTVVLGVILILISIFEIVKLVRMYFYF